MTFDIIKFSNLKSTWLPKDNGKNCRNIILKKELKEEQRKLTNQKKLVNQTKLRIKNLKENINE